ncbi:MAG: hypothetical protein ACTTHM_07940 [Peptoanaerobacter stomatis]|uniref:hypothetical protein n=1 Tax=Peptoanaerobacter stomatis TaxID=796937 RepID=UPI003F9FF8EC
MSIFLIETKKKFNKKNIVIIFLCICVSLIMALFVYNNSIYTGEIVDNKYNNIYGDKAVSQILSFSNKYYGFLENDKLVQAAKSYNENVNKDTKRSKPVYENLINSDACSIMYSFLYINHGRENPQIEWKDDAYIPLQIPEKFYELRHREVMYQAEKMNVVEKVAEMEKEVKLPFYLDKTASFWRVILEFFSVLVIIAIFASVITTAPSFSETFENGTRDILMNSKLGQKCFAKNRLIAELVYVSIMFIAIIIPYLSFMLFKIGYSGLNTSFQYISLFSSVNASIGKIFLIYIFVSWIGVLAMASLTMLFSSLLKKTYATGILSIVMVIVAYANSIFLRGGKSTLIDKVLSVMPMNTAEYIFVFSKNQFLNFGGFLFKLPFVIVAFYLLYIIVFSIMSAKTYRRMQ